ncbi:MAG: 2Fe-2S iron-sulfur cluster-binding protein [Nanoarchaeota archaeon]
MKKIKSDHGDKTINEPDEMKSALEDLGVPFSCEDGVCGTCLIEIEKGMDKLNSYTQPEKNMGMEGKFRLGCQCRFEKDGEVEVKID